MVKKYNYAHKQGYKSGLEEKLAEELEAQGIKDCYETVKIEWEDLTYRKYTPDFPLPNGVIVESKGYFTSDDRRKHLAIKEQHPELDIRFVFTRSSSKLSKKSKTTYGMWCDKHGFMYADRSIPKEWLEGPAKEIPELITVERLR